jgi:hypothetical protein
MCITVLYHEKRLIYDPIYVIYVFAYNIVHIIRIDYNYTIIQLYKTISSEFAHIFNFCPYFHQCFLSMVYRAEKSDIKRISILINVVLLLIRSTYRASLF